MSSRRRTPTSRHALRSDGVKADRTPEALDIMSPVCESLGVQGDALRGNSSTIGPPPNRALCSDSKASGVEVSAK